MIRRVCTTLGKGATADLYCCRRGQRMQGDHQKSMGGAIHKKGAENRTMHKMRGS